MELTDRAASRVACGQGDRAARRVLGKGVSSTCSSPVRYTSEEAPPQNARCPPMVHGGFFCLH